MIENIADLVSGEGRKRSDKKAHIKMLTTIIYWYLGDYYFHMSVDSSSLDEKGKYIDKAVKYYTLGSELVHIDGWSDKRLGGDILLARLYYLNCQWDLLDSILNMFLENANTAMSGFEMEKFSHYIIYPLQREPLSSGIAVWQTDRELFNALKMRPHTRQLTRVPWILHGV